MEEEVKTEIYDTKQNVTRAAKDLNDNIVWKRIEIMSIIFPRKNEKSEKNRVSLRVFSHTRELVRIP